MKKKFDCVDMMRKAQERIYRETRGLSREEELEYIHRAAAEFQAEAQCLREEIASGRRKPRVMPGQ